MSLKFDLESIPEDQGLRIEQTEDKNALGIDQPDCSLVQDVELAGNLTRIGRDVFFQGKAKTALQEVCSRCLEPFVTPVDVEITTCFLPVPEESPQEEKELRASDIEVEYYRENTIDLAQPVFDQILLTQPLIPLCRSDCKGLCVQCGANRNLELCQCGSSGENMDPRLAVLEKLKDKIK